MVARPRQALLRLIVSSDALNAGGVPVLIGLHVVDRDPGSLLVRCHERADTAAELAEYVRALRTTHRRKRTFIAALDAARLPG